VDAIESLPPLREVIRRHRLSARKTLGQHFLLDMNLTRRIARAAALAPDETVIEVGPGPGGLTRALLQESDARVVAIERDRRCIEALYDLIEAAGPRLRVIEGDALSMGLGDLAPPPRVVVANLPYNLSTALLAHWLVELYEHPGAVGRMILMFQKEVADRLRAGPGEKAYGRLSVITQWLCDVTPLFNVPAEAFTPPPKVVSSVIELRALARPVAPARLSLLERVTAAAFGQRRKMLRQSLKSLDASAAALLEAAGIEGTRRAETLSVEEFCALTRALEATLD
jgi:16S rRNA (adenine1518-N6/adenine1519-N6)-dimethyltransferase